MQRTNGDQRRRQDLADVALGHRPRLLLWTTDDGKQCMLSTSDQGGHLSRLADDFEAVQLALGAEVLTDAQKVLDDPMSPHAALRYAGIRLAECLTNVLRIAESRGLRLPVPDAAEAETEAEYEDESVTESA